MQSFSRGWSFLQQAWQMAFKDKDLIKPWCNSHYHRCYFSGRGRTVWSICVSYHGNVFGLLEFCRLVYILRYDCLFDL